MKRLMIGVLIGVGLCAQPSGNGFVVQYQFWSAQRQMRAKGTFSLTEFKAWQATKEAWKKFEREMDSEYRGERK